MSDLSGRMTTPARIALTLGLAVYGIVILLNPDDFRLLDNVDLAIHESGHVFFGFLGTFIGFLGGTLMQLLVPSVFVAYFIPRDRHAASVVLWWVAQNFWNISVYVKDARAQALPLVGGGEHDWAYLLGTLDMLDNDQGLGRLCHLIGVVIFGFSIWWGIVNARTEPTATSGAE